MKSIFVFIVFMFTISNMSHADLSFAEVGSSGPYEIKKVEPHTLIVEHLYSYWASTYTQPSIIHPIERSKVRFDTPEETLISYISAMVYQDIEWFVDNWETNDRSKILETFKGPETKEIAFDSWAKWLYGSKVRLLRRVNREKRGFVILEYSVESQNGEKEIWTANLIEEEGKWKVTNRFPADWISNYMSDPDGRISVPGDEY